MIFGKHINKYYKKYFWYFFFGILALIVVDYAQTVVPGQIGGLVRGIEKGSIISLSDKAFIEPIVTIFVIAVVMFIGRFSWRRCIFNESLKIQADLRKEMFTKAELLSQRYYKQNKTGAILAYFSNDLETIEEVLSGGIISVVDGIFLGLISLIKMFQVSAILTLIALIPLGILGVSAIIIDKYMEQKYERRQKAFEDMSDFSQENFTGIRVIKAFVKEGHELIEFSKVNKKNKDANIEFVKFGAILEVLIDLLIYSVLVIIFALGGYFVYQVSTGGQSNFDTGDIVTFVGLFDTIIWPVFALASIINTTARGKTSLKRISSLLDEEVEIKDDEKVEVVEKEEIKGGLRFNHLTFSYPDQPEKLVLNDVTFEIKPGETVGVIGKVGAGKSTLVNMLFRLYNLEKGKVFIDGHDIMTMPIKQVRDSIGYAPQDNFLFSDTIRSNIAFADDSISDNKVSDAATFSDVRDNIENFENKYMTMIGERGVTLSGGQKQRISISRAVVKNPPILVLDDSVSAVDIKTEEEIIANIKKQRLGKTTILIASRVSTVEKLDKVLVLNRGVVEFFGTNKECLEHSPTYAKMVELQTLEKEMEG